MASSLRCAPSPGKSAQILANSCNSSRQLFRGSRLIQNCRSSSNSAAFVSVSMSTVRWCCQTRVEKVFGAKGAVYVCTDHLRVDAKELSSLLAASNQNCEQFPFFRADGTVVPVDPGKLRRALRHSTVVVALYVEGGGDDDKLGVQSAYVQVPQLPGRGWLDYLKPESAGKRRLVAFGRATSDISLTASIYDLVGIETERHMRHCCDPHARAKELFEKCGFAPDQLNSTTMMYTRGPTNKSQVASDVKEYGRRMYLIPPPLSPRASTRILDGSRL